jgi:rubrerythrin
MKPTFNQTNETNVLEFFSNATYLLFKAKQSLAYSYAIGYFLSSKTKLDFFEFIQGELEQAALKLDELTNIDVRKFIMKVQDHPFHQNEFQEYRSNVVKLTEVIKNFFEKSFIELESGLPEIKDEEYKDDVNEAQMLIEEVKNGKWICQNCTFANFSSDFFCNMCKNPKDSYNAT